MSSPWLRQIEATTPVRQATNGRNLDPADQPVSNLILNSRITRLEAEPQDGPVEYKLHLLLRPRRNFTNMSTVAHIAGSTHSNVKFNGPHTSKSISDASLIAGTAVFTQQSRQHRLEQLTTQLLWRLQQSSPHHASSATNVVLPSFPEALPELQAPLRPAKLPHGLEESQGALYEIGVSDDGTFVGLAEDEMRESLNNLRAMAACLGCVVEIQRMVDVGQCDWRETAVGNEMKVTNRRGKLVVAEALVKPYLDRGETASGMENDEGITTATEVQFANERVTAQLRVSFTGATMSGKSSLLGALSTTTLDNGRGQSRLSMLKHRHEITSGVTSSITQELIGYRDMSGGGVEAINYATEGISSWIDMHAASVNGRLVFASDSAGHPRYRRTTVRGLVGWDPYWAILCIPADDEGDSSGKIGSTPSSVDMLGPAASGVDLSAAHVDLCLRLDLPLVVAITKFDLASKTGFRLTLAKLLSIIKAAGRQPVVIPNPPGGVNEEDMQMVPSRKVAAIRKAIAPLMEDPTKFVPIIMTSAVQGTGLDVLHVLLRELPIPARITVTTGDVALEEPVFHIEDIYNKTLGTKAIVVSGHQRCGTITVGQTLMLGPCSTTVDDSEDSDGQPRRPSMSTGLQTSRSFPGALRGSSLLLAKSRMTEQEWRCVRIVSVRNLRLPVNTLHPDQVGTIGLQLAESDEIGMLSTLKIRKGMVLCKEPVKSISTVVALFKREDLGSLAVGSQVVLYIASIRAAARILSARTPDPKEAIDQSFSSISDMVSSLEHSSLEQDRGPTAGTITDHMLMVTLHFESTREYVEVGSRVLVMPGGGPGLFGGAERGEKGSAGLEGFVGTVTEACY